ncbi:hypothetical protein [Streptomyces sp. NPDC005438]|uniref:hypothetical protein n=1 Tax=Streptomyces sp. NPDC005438 TaxID=3156880 RepID=UPI0033A9B977
MRSPGQTETPNSSPSWAEDDPGPPPEWTPARTSADPVQGMLRRHRQLCERAVDPWEIAAGLEAAGVGERTVHRLRHRDVFTLAEELYARRTPEPAPTEQAPAPPAPAPDRPAPAWWTPCAPLAAAGGAWLWWTRSLDWPLRLALGAPLALALLWALDRLARELALPAGARRWALWSLCGAAMAPLLGGGPQLAWAAAPLGLALAVGPARWLWWRFVRLAAHELAGSRRLADFTSRTRLLLALSVGLAVLAGALAAALACLALGWPGSAVWASTAALAGALALVPPLTLYQVHPPVLRALRLAGAAQVLVVALAVLEWLVRRWGDRPEGLIPSSWPSPLGPPVRLLVGEGAGPVWASAVVHAALALFLAGCALRSVTVAHVHHRDSS